MFGFLFTFCVWTDPILRVAGDAVDFGDVLIVTPQHFPFKFESVAIFLLYSLQRISRPDDIHHFCPQRTSFN